LISQAGLISSTLSIILMFSTFDNVPLYPLHSVSISAHQPFVPSKYGIFSSPEVIPELV
jgi:hypothetical protein